VQKSAIMNLRKAIEKAGLKADNIVLSGYASAISTLNEDEKALGTVLIDLGGSSCNMVIHSGNSIRYNDFLSVGSLNITTDISTVLHTPPAVAEEVKIKYGTLKPRSNELIVLPDLGDENSNHEVDISVIINVIYMRVEEAHLLAAEAAFRADPSGDDRSDGALKRRLHQLHRGGKYPLPPPFR
jgi:cell division protein FtsA